jgi:Spy/CpxP family protein refolding chaperone
MRFLTICIVLLLVLNAVTLFILFHMHLGQLHNMHGGEGPAKYIIEELKLDAKQQEQFAELRNKHHDFARNAHKEEERLHDLYFSLLKTDNPDKMKVDSIATLIGTQHTALATATFQHFQQLRAICRDDQKKLFDATVDEIARMVTGPPRPEGPPH